MKNKDTNKGITLIALVITIIVMLILVAVTISMAVNGGLFDYTGKATGETQNAINAEQTLASGKVEIDGVLYETIDDYIAESSLPVHDWTREGDTFTCSHCSAIYRMGDVVNYTAAGKTSTTLTAEKSGLDKYNTNARNSSGYPDYANVDDNGNQTIEAQDTNWIVLGIEDTDKDGVEETLLITTESYVLASNEKQVFFYGAAAYNNAIDEINRICKELYSNGKYGKARGMTIEDVNNALNYTPTGDLTTKLKELYIIEGKTYTPDGTNTEEALGEYELNGYWIMVDGEDRLTLTDNNSSTSSITDLERNAIFGAEGNYLYWLATRGVSLANGYATSGLYGFGPGFVRLDTAYSYDALFFSNGNEFSDGAGLRPVVSLRAKLPELM